MATNSIVKPALRYGADINLANIKGNTALHYAYEYQYYELAGYLESKGADTKKKNRRGLTPMQGIRPQLTDIFDLNQYSD
jgi:ankyrin repeat protein